MSIIDLYAQFIQFIEDTSGMTRSMLHIHAGMAIYLGTQFLLRDRRSSIYALVVVVQAELFNEVMNWLHRGSWNWSDTVTDILLTVFWPTVCYAVGTYRRKRWTDGVPQPVSDIKALDPRTA